MARRSVSAVIVGIVLGIFAGELWTVGAQPPDHPVFANLRFIQVLPDRKRVGGIGPADTRVAVLGRRLLSTLGAPPIIIQALDSGLFPGALEADYKPAKKLGEGSFGVAFLAEMIATKEMVVVKLLKHPMTGDWMTAASMNDPSTKEFAHASERECDNAKAIHENKDKDEEGDKHVATCIVDGIKLAMQDPSKSMPLFVVMKYDGPKNLGEYWLQVVLPVARAGDTASAATEFQSLAKQMMEGLRFMGESGGETVGFVHHDLKTENMVVQPGPPGVMSGKLTIIDLGTVLSTQRPKETSACTVVMRPPEVSWAEMFIGFKMPVHSFDSWSAAMTLVSMAAAKEADNEVVPFFWILAAHHLDFQPRDLVDIARCLEKSRAQAESGNLEEELMLCVNAGVVAGIKKRVNNRLDVVRESRGSKRRKELARLLACRMEASGLGQAVFTRNDSPMLDQVVDQWMRTGFDHVLLKMFSENPSNRPTPSEVLESRWLKEADLHSSTPPELEFSCEDFATNSNMVTTMAEILGHILIVLFCMGCCCCGGFMSLACKLPSMLWTGPAIAALLLSTGFGAGQWSSKNRMLWYMLGIPPAIGFLCALTVRFIDPSRKRAWKFAIGVALILFMCFFAKIMLATSPVRREFLNVFNKQEEVKNWQDVGVIIFAGLAMSWFYFLPPLMGICFSLFGLWRAGKDETSQGSQPTLSPGIQMRTVA